MRGFITSVFRRSRLLQRIWGASSEQNPASEIEAGPDPAAPEAAQPETVGLSPVRRGSPAPADHRADQPEAGRGDTSRAVEPGKAVEGAVTATPNPLDYTAPTEAQRAAIERDVFGDEDQHLEPGYPSRETLPYDRRGVSGSDEPRPDEPRPMDGVAITSGRQAIVEAILRAQNHDFDGADAVLAQVRDLPSHEARGTAVAFLLDLGLLVSAGELLRRSAAGRRWEPDRLFPRWSMLSLQNQNLAAQVSRTIDRLMGDQASAGGDLDYEGAVPEDLKPVLAERAETNLDRCMARLFIKLGSPPGPSARSITLTPTDGGGIRA